MRYFARILIFVWAGFWIYFGLATAIGEKLNFVQTTYHVVAPGVIFLILALAAWLWEKIGGILLVITGLILILGYFRLAFGFVPIFTIILILVTMAMPPIIVGAIFLLESKKGLVQNKPKESAPNK